MSFALASEGDQHPQNDKSEYLNKVAYEAEAITFPNPDKLDSVADILERESLNEGDSSFYMISFSLRGIRAAMQNDFGPALKYFHDNWEYGKSHGDTAMQVNALNNMAGVYISSGNFKKAQDRQQRALELINSEEDATLFANLEYALGISLNRQNKFDSADNVLKHAMQIFREQEEMHLAQSCMSEMANTLERRHKYKDALRIYDKMIALYPFTEDLPGEVFTNQRKGSVLMRLGRMREAAASFEYSLALSDSVDYMIDRDSTLIGLIKANAAMGNLVGAETYTSQLIKFIEVRERKKNQELIAFVESRYNFEEESRKNEALLAELALTREDLKRNQLYLRFALAGIVVLILSLIVIFKRMSSLATNAQKNY